MAALSTLLSNEETFARFKVKLPEPLLLRRAISDIGAASSESRGVSEDVATLQQRLADAVAADGVAGLSNRDIREGCRSFMTPPRPPGREPDVGSALAAEVGRRRKRAALNALIEAYLDSFTPDDEDVGKLAKQLRGLFRSWTWRETDTWPDRVERFALLKPEQAPRRISDTVLDSGGRVLDVLDAAGLGSDARKTGGLSEAAFKAACQKTAALRADRSIPFQLCVIDWARVARTPLAYPSAWVEYASALFVPWRLSEPESEHRQALIEAALSWAGDPRVKPARWRPVQEAGLAYDVIVRWLTKASVEQFFDIVSETMTDRPDMWRARRAFWTRYLKADLIDAAWVAFCSDGAWRAEQAARRSNDPALAMFGRCSTGGGKGAEHAALIMKIGDLTIVDWSHNGSWNVWPSAAKGAPELFRHNQRGWHDYSPQELMGAPVRGSHDAGGNWRWRVETLIHDETGRRP